MKTLNWQNIQPAGGTHPHGPLRSENGYNIMPLKFSVPLDHNNPNHPEFQLPSSSISISANLVYSRAEFTISTDLTPSWTSFLAQNHKTILVYLCGGPGDANPPCRNPDLNGEILKHHGWPILYPNYRGTSGEDAVTGELIARIGAECEDPEEQAVRQAEYLSYFRQDAIVADLEAIRLRLPEVLGLAKGEEVKYILLGQSYGGWIATTYLSFLPGGLERVYLSAGLPPVGRTPREVYERLFEGVREKNRQYYRRNAADRVNIGDNQKVKEVLGKLWRMYGDKGAELPDGSRLTPRGFMTMGRRLGGSPAEDWREMHRLVELLANELNEEDRDAAKQTLAKFHEAGGTGFKLLERPLYAVLHEKIYCCGPGVASQWAAQQVGKEKAEKKKSGFSWLRDDFSFDEIELTQLFFSGEMIFEFMLHDAGPKMEPFIRPARLLAEKTDWPNLYDEEQLARNDVPVRALAYPNDMHVAWNFCEETARKINGCELVKGSARLRHGSIRSEPEAVLRELFGKD
ncbi:alpha/beta-hydrolase [Canariomyces notabilis]|uniref:Alpha/beta-hydrolase n=1 Tax=Canariomyces notabilis TaxID=2074819 RepID=A0AAN6TF29_9PEZI|nr:alpha/beta-hydrolase [Canariomyces arenarius]